MSEAMVYEIRVRGVLDEKWHTYFAPLEVTAGAEDTALTGLVHDQAELFGILFKICDLGLSLLSVNPLSGSVASNQ